MTDENSNSKGNFYFRYASSSSLLAVPQNTKSGDTSGGLSEIINEMEKKLDSAQRKFNPSFDKEQALRKAQEVKQFSLELEKDAEQVLRRSKTSAAATTARRRSSRNEKTPSTVERTGYVPSHKLDDDGDDAYTPE